VFLGSGSDNARQALVFSPTTTILEGESRHAKLRTAGLPHVKAVVQRLVNKDTTLSLIFSGQVSNDIWIPLGPATAVPAAAVGQVVVATIDVNGFTMVRADLFDVSAPGVGDTSVNLTLSATWT
jgi:hypothetical protein